MPSDKATLARGQEQDGAGHLIRLAQAAGAIRPDVRYEDFIYVITAISKAIENYGASTSRIGHLVDLFLNGISTRGSQVSPPEVRKR